jgi:hypothetical protein
MTADGQRIADLERQLADLTARFAKLEHQAFVVRTLEEARVRYLEGGSAPAVTPVRRPRHLHAVGGAR